MVLRRLHRDAVFSQFEWGICPADRRLQGGNSVIRRSHFYRTDTEEIVGRNDEDGGRDYLEDGNGTLRPLVRSHSTKTTQLQFTNVRERNELSAGFNSAYINNFLCTWRKVSQIYWHQPTLVFSTWSFQPMDHTCSFHLWSTLKLILYSMSITEWRVYTVWHKSPMHMSLKCSNYRI